MSVQAFGIIAPKDFTNYHYQLPVTNFGRGYLQIHL